MDNNIVGDEYKASNVKELTREEKDKLESQNSRMLTGFQAAQLEKNAKKNWDLFYKRNDTRFFKDRHWTTREFHELLNAGDHDDDNNESMERKTMLEVGCGVGNLIFPLVEDKLNNYFINACDFSTKAVELARENPLYDPESMNIFQCDITTKDLLQSIPRESIDIVTMIFVLSAIHPDKFVDVFTTIFDVLKPGGALLFRDYGIYDMAQLRFKAGSKIGENFYVRQDGTRSYYFSIEELELLANSSGFRTLSNDYVHRRTINKKENIDAPRIFIQCKFQKLGNV